MEELEKEMSVEFNGWVSKGGGWRPTECQARVKVRCCLYPKSCRQYFVGFLGNFLEASYTQLGHLGLFKRQFENSPRSKLRTT